MPPSGRFWLKADGTDVKAALQEATKGEWNGDVTWVMANLKNVCKSMKPLVHKVLDHLNNDKSFLALGLTRATNVYQAKFDCACSTSEETFK